LVGVAAAAMVGCQDKAIRAPTAKPAAMSQSSVGTALK
jgi:hypothetical protein